MNAYNNITWESDRLEYEEGSTDYSNTLLAILGFPSKPQKCRSSPSLILLTAQLTLTIAAEYDE